MRWLSSQTGKRSFYEYWYWDCRIFSLVYTKCPWKYNKLLARIQGSTIYLPATQAETSQSPPLKTTLNHKEATHCERLRVETLRKKKSLSTSIGENSSQQQPRRHDEARCCANTTRTGLLFFVEVWETGFPFQTNLNAIFWGELNWTVTSSWIVDRSEKLEKYVL